MEKFTLPAFAKINWFLRILGKRDDGFHELLTAFQTVSLHDDLTFSEAEKIILTCDDESVPTDDSNLIFRAAECLQKKYRTQQGAKIHLTKRIPSPGGLGGGSSDAATALIGLTKLWSLPFNLNDLCEIGAELGSDVPFFLFGGTAFGTGRGTEIFPCEDLEEKIMLIVTPDAAVPTKDAFARLNVPRLTKSDKKHILTICREELKEFRSRHFDSANDFEKVIFEIEPEIGRVKKMLSEHGATFAQMSGSGASVFGIFEKEETRQATLEALEKEKNWRKFAVSTVSRKIFRDAFAKAQIVVSD